jgi:hypothetical protein
MSLQDGKNSPSRWPTFHNIEFAVLSSQCTIARAWETSNDMGNIGVRASTYCDRHIKNKLTV